ncbi:hypothetical protein Bbelb_204920 [Branchiostoma belcheri]|nr:hypothetical protein Bbelb_204920 [Branchiostoma belcheri]
MARRTNPKEIKDPEAHLQAPSHTSVHSKAGSQEGGRKAETKTGTPRGRPRKAAAPTPKTKVPVITVSESEEETSVVVKVAQITASNSAAHAEKKEEVSKVAENSGPKPVSTTHVGKQLLNFQKVAAQEQEIAKKVTPSRKTHVVTVTESDQESDHELRRSALRSRGLTRQVFSASSTASSVTTRQESSEVATMTTRSAAVKQETHVETPVSSRLTRASLNSVRDGKVGLFSGARSRVAVRMGKVRRLLTCHNFLNLVFVVCMGAVFYTLFFLKK